LAAQENHTEQRILQVNDPHTQIDAKGLITLIDSRFQIPVVEGEDKLCPLDVAIRKRVKKGMTIHFAGRCGALLYQLIRELWNKKPDSTLVSTGVAATVLALIQGSLVNKIITSFVGDCCPSPRPNPLVQKACLSGEIQFETWTMLTIPQRIFAGAMGRDSFPPGHYWAVPWRRKTSNHSL